MMIFGELFIVLLRTYLIMKFGCQNFLVRSHKFAFSHFLKKTFTSSTFRKFRYTGKWFKWIKKKHTLNWIMKNLFSEKKQAILVLLDQIVILENLLSMWFPCWKCEGIWRNESHCSNWVLCKTQRDPHKQAKVMRTFTSSSAVNLVVFYFWLLTMHDEIMLKTICFLRLTVVGLIFGGLWEKGGK